MEREIVALLKYGKLEKALELASSSNLPEFSDNTLLLQSQLATAKRNSLMGLIDQRTYSIEQNRISNALLTLVRDLSAGNVKKDSKEIISRNRFALIMGCNAYKSLTKLKNCTNDARDICLEFERLSMFTELKIDLGRTDFLLALERFSNSLVEGCEAVFYFAGHGFQSKGQNFLVPTDATISSESDVPTQCINISDILKQLMVRKPRTLIIVLDACRNNPFERSLANLFLARGFAKPEELAGVLIAFSTAAGRTASDGDGNNGLYTEVLLGELSSQGIAAELMFQKVRKKLIEKSNGEQVSWESTSLTHPFYFNPE